MSECYRSIQISFKTEKARNNKKKKRAKRHLTVVLGKSREISQLKDYKVAIYALAPCYYILLTEMHNAQHLT